MANKVIVIDPGHGGHDPGALGNGLRESDLTLRMSLKVRDQLNNDWTGHKVMMTRITDTNLTLNARTNFANSNNAAALISIHCNAFSQASANGFESFVYTNPTTASINFQNVVHDRLTQFYRNAGLTNRGKKRGNLHMVREARCPSILIENLFITNKEILRFNDKTFEDNVARLTAEGIATFLNLPRKSTPPNPTPPPVENNDMHHIKTRTAGFVTAADAKAGQKRKTWVEPNNYHIFRKFDGMINVTRTKDSPGSWINPGTITVPPPPNININSHVRVNNNAQKYVTGENIPSWVRGQVYTVHQLRNSNNEILLREIMSWIKRSDITLV